MNQWQVKYAELQFNENSNQHFTASRGIFVQPSKAVRSGCSSKRHWFCQITLSLRRATSCNADSKQCRHWGRLHSAPSDTHRFCQPCKNQTQIVPLGPKRKPTFCQKEQFSEPPPGPVTGVMKHPTLPLISNPLFRSSHREEDFWEMFQI